MDKITFENLPRTTTPLNAENMNAIQTNAENAINAADVLRVNGTNINENDDLDNYTTAGVYYCNSTAICNSLANCPVTSVGFKLIVEYLHTTTRMVQIIKLNAVNPKIYIRNYTGSWNEWTKIVDDREIYYKAGDTIVLSSNASFNGFVTGGGNTLYMTIIPPKRLDKVSVITINSLKLNIRGITGYIGGGSGVDFSSYVSLATLSNSKDAIVIGLTNSNGWGVLNNTPISVAPSNNTAVSITFS